MEQRTSGQEVYVCREEPGVIVARQRSKGVVCLAIAFNLLMFSFLYARLTANGAVVETGDIAMLALHYLILAHVWRLVGVRNSTILLSRDDITRMLSDDSASGRLAGDSVKESECF
jgi:hypothetical protein